MAVYAHVYLYNNPSADHVTKPGSGSLDFSSSITNVTSYGIKPMPGTRLRGEEGGFP